MAYVPEVKEGDIVRYPIGFTLVVRKVERSPEGNLAVKTHKVNDKQYWEWIYQDQYPWGGALFKERGFRHANESEMHLLDQN